MLFYKLFFFSKAYLIEDNEAFTDEEGPVFPHEKLSLSKKPSEKISKSDKDAILTETYPSKKIKISSPLFQPHYPMKIEKFAIIVFLLI